MHLVHIDTGREMRGGQRQALLLMRGLRDRGNRCELLARPETPIWQAAAALGFETRAADFWNLRERTRAADLAHVHDAHAHTLAAIAARCPFVVSRRVAFPVKRGVFSRWKYARPRRYLAVSRFVADELVEAGVPRERIDVVYDGFERLHAVSEVPRGGTKIVALVSRDPAKGRSLVERAAREVQVEVTFSEDLERDLPGAAMFLYATHSEGLGSAALLAMSLGVPVIASRVGGLPEVIEHEVSGLLAENTAAAFGTAIDRLLTDYVLRERLARGARIRVENEFTAEQMIERTLASYARALDSR